MNSFLLGLPLVSTVKQGSTTVTLATNTYDSYSTYPLTPVSGLFEFDSNYGNASLTVRGNLTQSLTPGATSNVGYDMTGTVTAADDGNGHAVSVTAAANTNNSAPGAIQPNTGQANDSNLATTLSYSPFLALNSSTAPNSALTTLNYDSAGRVALAAIPDGATTSYSYAFGTTVNGNISNGPYTTTATTGTHWTVQILDGLGRPTIAQALYTGGASASEVDTTYAPCACSPGGKMSSVTQPYAPGSTVYKTQYFYDGLGRTLSVVQPDGASTTTYAYQGNWTTLVDPAGKWKQYESDVFGNTTVVVEPDPLATPLVTAPPSPPSITVAGTMVTTYTYDYANHLIQVLMPRTVSGSTVTQTRTFVYNPTTLRLTSQTNPETGTTSYGYNADGTLNTRTDAKGLITTYAYDSYQRVTQVTHKPSGSPIDPNQTVTFVYDQGANGYGRLSSASGGVCPQNSSLATYTDTYTYAVAGEVATKTLTLCGGIVMSGGFAYDSEGKLVTMSYPQGMATGNGPAPVITYSYDAMSRLTGATTPVSLGPGGGCTWNGTATWASAAGYNPAGQLTALQQLGSISTSCSGGNAGVTPAYLADSWVYNHLNQLTAINIGSSSMTYTYSATQNNAQITGATDSRTGDALTYTYDLLKRLTKTVSSGPAWQQNFQYDGFGNLTSKSAPVGSGEPVFPGVDSSTNRLTGASYDANGNVTAINGSALVYDGENRLVSSSTGSGTDTNVYDEQGHRVWQTLTSGTSLGYFYGPDGKLLSVFQLQLSNPQTTYIQYHQIYFGGLLLGTTKAYVGGEESTITDRLGSKHQTYAYGTDVPNQTSQGDSSAVDFATYLSDPGTGFQYANERWYTAGYGRFLRADPYGGSAQIESPETWNRYSYATADPVNESDPSGLDEGDAVVTDDQGPNANLPLPGIGPGVEIVEIPGILAQATGWGAMPSDLIAGALYGLLQLPLLETAPDKTFTVLKHPGNALKCQGMGSTFYAPPGFSLSTIMAAGKANGENIFKTLGAVGFYGTFDYQRVVDGQGNTTFYSDFSAVSNIAVGIYMYAAGYAESTMSSLAGAFATALSSNSTSSVGAKNRALGYEMAKTNAKITCSKAGK